MAAFDEYEHDYKQIQECKDCGETQENCECPTFDGIDIEGVDECHECALTKEDPVHVKV